MDTTHKSLIILGFVSSTPIGERLVANIKDSFGAIAFVGICEDQETKELFYLLCTVENLKPSMHKNIVSYIRGYMKAYYEIYDTP